MTPESTTPAAEAVIGQAAITAVGALSPAQLLSAVTPERIGELTGYSASSIRYRLNADRPADPAESKGQGRGWSFDRERLLACAVDAYRLRAHDARTRTLDHYGRALAALEAGDARPLERALEGEIREFTDGDAERLYLIALAGSKGSPAISQLLSKVEDDRRLATRTLTRQGLVVLGREPGTGVKGDDIAEAVNHYLRGVASRRGFEPEAGRGIVLRAVIGLVLALTDPSSDGPGDAVSDALGGLAVGP